MNADRFFDDSLDPSNALPPIEQLATLAVFLNAERCVTDPKQSLKAAARLWFRASQLRAALAEALSKTDGGVQAWEILGENDQAVRTHKTLQKKEQLRTSLKIVDSLPGDTVTAFKWFTNNASTKKDRALSEEAFREELDRFMEASNQQFERMGIAPIIPVALIRQFIEWRTQQRSAQRKRLRTESCQQILKKHSPKIVPTEPRRTPNAHRRGGNSEEPRSRPRRSDADRCNALLPRSGNKTPTGIYV